MATILGIIVFFGVSGFILWHFNEAIWQGNDLTCLDKELDSENKNNAVDGREIQIQNHFHGSYPDFLAPLEILDK